MSSTNDLNSSPNLQPGCDKAPSVLQAQTECFDAAWWQREIVEVTSVSDPVLCNLRITLAHYNLSRLLQSVIGADAGANFHTWAIWGSKKAGETIRREDTRLLGRIMLAITGASALVLVATGVAAPSVLSFPVSLALGSLFVAGPMALLNWVLNRTSRQILAGNIIVLEDIGNVTARFAEAVHASPAFDVQALEQFAETLRPGRTEDNGQALLNRAFLCYYLARHEPDVDKKHEHMLLANCYAILHEHIRLQPYIRAAMPAPFRRLITARLLRFYLGQEALRVRADVPADQEQAFPETLRELDNPELIAFLQGMEGWDRTPNQLAASRATDWADLSDRMNFIVDLFRSRHLSPKILSRPFTEEQIVELKAGRLPRGPL